MGSAAGVVPSMSLPTSASKAKSPIVASDATKKRPKIDHGRHGSKRSKLNIKESATSGVNAAKEPVQTSPNKAQALNRGMFLAFIDNALQQRRNGRNEGYNELVAQFRAWSSPAEGSTSATPIPSSATLKSWTEALTHVVAQLDRSHSTLVEAAIAVPWTMMDESYAGAYIRFVQALLCSRSEFVQTTLEKIVKGFRFHFANVFPGEDGPNETTRRQTYDRLHKLLSSLIYLIPTLPSTLWPIMNRHFPHKRENRNCQVVYIANALKIVEYCPQLGENVLGAIILRAIQIDVEIQVDIEELEDDEGVLDEEVFGFSIENPFDKLVGDDDDSDSDSDDEGGNLDDISSDENSDDEDPETAEGQAKKEKVLSPKVIKRLKEMAAKLDAILRVTFDFLHRLNGTGQTPTRGSPRSDDEQEEKLGLTRSASTSTINALQDAGDKAVQASIAAHNTNMLRRTMSDVLLALFDEKILRTFQTRFTQFILFWYASLSPEFVDHFSGTLLSRVLDEQDTPVITRVAAAGYLASFVARSHDIDRTAVRNILSMLCSYIDAVMEDLRLAHAQYGVRLDAGKIVKSSVVFYAICQTAFYIFCFRWKDLLDEAEEDDGEVGYMEGVPSSVRRWMPELETLKQAVNNPLNPLKMCSPAVVSQFARMAHKTDFVYCHSIIEQNKRQSRRSTMSESQLPTPSAEHPTQPSLARSSSQPSPVELNLVQQTLKEAQIDSHFPFDPFKLPLSATYINPIYRQWSSGFDDEEDEDEDTETENPEEESEANSSAVPSSVDSEASSTLAPPPGSIPMQHLIDPALLAEGQDDPFSKSFEAMSVSPRRNTLLMAGL